MPTLLQCVVKIATTTSNHQLYNTHLLVLAEISKLFSSLASISQGQYCKEFIYHLKLYLIFPQMIKHLQLSCLVLFYVLIQQIHQHCFINKQ